MGNGGTQRLAEFDSFPKQCFSSSYVHVHLLHVRCTNPYLTFRIVYDERNVQVVVESNEKSQRNVAQGRVSLCCCDTSAWALDYEH